MRSLLKSAAALLYPPRCFACRRVLTAGEDFYCRTCAPKYADGKAVYRRDAEFLRSVCAPFLYQGAGADAVRDLKFQKVRWLVRPAAEMMKKALDAQKEPLTYDLVTWVPLYKEDKRKRGFDQSELLAIHLARLMGLPTMRALEKVQKTAKQSSLSAEERRANVIGIYRAHAEKAWRGKRILLVDDVITTGNTVSEAARVLLTAGAAEVSAVAIALVKE